MKSKISRFAISAQFASHLAMCNFNGRNSIQTILAPTRLSDTEDFFWQIAAGIENRFALFGAPLCRVDGRVEIGRFDLCQE